MPAIRQRSRVCAKASAVSAMIGTVAAAPSGSARIDSVAPTPSSSGMCRSISTMSKRRSRMACTASSPLPAKKGWWPMPSSSAAMYWRFTGWSSATSTRSEPMPGSAPSATGGRWRHRRPGRGRQRLQRHAEAEAAAFAGHALGGDVAAHQPRQAARDLQAQPGAAVAPRARFVALREALEQPVQRGLVHADAGVGDDELEHLAAVVVDGAVQVEHDHAAVGELDGVVHQVEQDLLDAGAVGAHLLGDAGVGIDVQRQRLELRLRPHQRLDLAQQVAQVHRLLGQRQPAGFEQRHVEHVVQDRQQVVGRFGGGAQVVDLARVQPGVAQQREHAQQAVEGRADLVAHVGQEHALRLAGGLGLALRLAQVRGQVDQRALALAQQPHLAHRHQPEGQHQQRQEQRQQPAPPGCAGARRRCAR